ncbi:MAG: hypothetical protein M4D80_09120 [Myxococcota bacterium]|nr:hypothetical protein [Myxococcota bacterium]
MRCLLLGLTACWSTSPPPSKTPAPAPLVVGPVVPAPAPPPAPKAYRLPVDVAAALATEALSGNVLVPAYARLFPTEVAARADAQAPDLRGAVAMRVVRDHGDVVAVETAPVADCIAGFSLPYHLTVFVRRDQLVPRAKNDRIKMFADGTGVAIDGGAPVEISATGLAWRSTELAATSVPPSEHQLAYAAPPRTQAAQLPAMTGEPMVCDYKVGTTTLTEWRAERKRKRDAEAEKARAERAAQLATLAREGEAEQQKCKAREAAAAKRKRNAKDPFPRISSCVFVGSLGPSGLGSAGLSSGRSYDLLDEERYVPYCSVREPPRYTSTTTPVVPPPTINGVAMPWPDGHSSVVEIGGKYFADVEHGCGRSRMIVDRGGLEKGGLGAGRMGRGNEQQVQVWVPKAGPVTWPDGSPAGTYRGVKRYRNVTEMGDRICVRVGNVAEMVCHDKRVAKTEMVFPSLLRD